MSFEVTENDPANARWSAVLLSGVLAPLTMILGIVTAGLLVSLSNPIGWLIVVVATVFGVLPLVRWVLRERQLDRVSLHGLNPKWRRTITTAAAAVERIDRRRSAMVEGPLRDHVDDCYQTALRYARRLETIARSDPSDWMAAESIAVERDLEDLADAVDNLILNALGSDRTRLQGMIEQTRLIERALVDDGLPRLERTVSEDEAADDRAQGSDSTNAR